MKDKRSVTYAPSSHSPNAVVSNLMWRNSGGTLHTQRVAAHFATNTNKKIRQDASAETNIRIPPPRGIITFDNPTALPTDTTGTTTPHTLKARLLRRCENVPKRGQVNVTNAAKLQGRSWSKISQWVIGVYRGTHLPLPAGNDYICQWESGSGVAQQYDAPWWRTF